MIAPRAVIALGNPGYEWLGDESGYKSMMAATEVWKAMGIEDRIGFDFTGNHEHCQAASSQNQSVTAFIDKFLRNKSANTDIHVKPTNGKGFKIDNYADWIAWETPTLPYEEAPIDTQTVVPPDTQSVEPPPSSLASDCSAPALGMRVATGRLEVTGAPDGARVKLYDVRGNVVATMGATGGNLPKAKGRLLAIVENASGKRLMTKVINNTGF
jgi:hypothetical protein